jgi:hypothetical protein
MPRTVRHSKYEANKPLYNYNQLENSSDDNCWLVFLSDRDLGIIYEAIEYANKQQTRVFTAVDDDVYTIADETEWGNFKWWVNQLYDHLGARGVTNQLLERIADNLEMDVVVDNIGTVETRSITQVLAGSFGGADFDELLDALDDEGDGIDDYGLKDWLEVMTYTKQLLPNFNAPSLFPLVKAYFDYRFRNKLLGQLAMVNVNLRYQGLALAPKKASATADDEKSFIEDIYTQIDNIPWLTSGVAALADPSPAGETLLASKMAEIVGSTMFQYLKDWLINLFSDDPEAVPEASIVGMLEKIANAAGGGSNSQSLTFQQIINNISSSPGDDDQTDFPYLYAILSQVMDFLPDDQGDYPVPDPATLVQTAILDRTLKEMSDRIDDLDLSVTNNNTVNPPVNNFAPVNNFDPTTNVNFDISALETQLISIKDNLLDISGDTDALAHLDRLNDITTNLGAIENRVSELQCICDKLSALVLGADQSQIIPPLSQFNSPDTYRCDAAKWYLGKMTEIFSVLKEEAESWGGLVLTNVWNFYVSLYSEASQKLSILLGFIDPRLEELLLATSIQETLYLNDVITDLQDQWLSDIYNAASPDAAITAMMARLDAFTPVGYTVTDDMKDGIEIFLQRSRGLERVFLPDGSDLVVTQEEIDIYSGWNSDPCAVVGVWNCFPQLAAWNYGSVSPLIFTGSAWNLTNYPIGTWATITSEWENNDNQRIKFTCDDGYTLEVELLSIPSGKQVELQITDCDNQYMYNNDNTPTGLIYTGQADQIQAFTIPAEVGVNPGTFQIRIRRID